MMKYTLFVVLLLIVLSTTACSQGETTVGVGSDGTVSIATEGRTDTTVVIQGDGVEVACSPAARETGVCL